MTNDLPILKIENQRLAQQIAFIMEMDKLKSVDRMTKIVCEDRVENDAEHSWHVALMALVLAPYAKVEVDVQRVITLLLIHDVVEIDAGDTYIYSNANADDQFSSELKAAKRIFGLLPAEQANFLTEAWQEFEARETLEAKFAKAIDRLSPFVYYAYAGEGCLIEQGVNVHMVRKQMVSIADVSVPLQEMFEKLLAAYVEFGVVLNSDGKPFGPKRDVELAKSMADFNFGDPDLHQRMQFVIELDKLKSILRQTQLVSVDRLENDAEHSWNLAIMAVLMTEYANQEVDLLRILKMLLIHDIVEIDAGDSPIYDAAAKENQVERELVAAKRLFGLLPQEVGEEFMALWQEFEAHKSSDAQFARSMDRLSPLLYNFYTKGVRWAKFGVSNKDVLKRLMIIKDGSGALWDLGQSIIEQAVENGFLKRFVDERLER